MTPGEGFKHDAQKAPKRSKCVGREWDGTQDAYAIYILVICAKSILQGVKIIIFQNTYYKIIIIKREKENRVHGGIQWESTLLQYVRPWL